MFVSEAIKESNANHEPKQFLNVHRIHVVYPYVCSVIYQAVTQAGFQAIHLGPMNFEVIYQEKQKKKKEDADKQSAGNAIKSDVLN